MCSFEMKVQNVTHANCHFVQWHCEMVLIKMFSYSHMLCIKPAYTQEEVLPMKMSRGKDENFEVC